MLSLLANKDYHTQHTFISSLDILIPHNSIFWKYYFHIRRQKSLYLFTIHSDTVHCLGAGGREKNWDLEKFLNRKLWSNKSGEGEREIERGNIRSGDYIKQRAGGWGGELEVWKWEWSVEWGRGGYYPAPVAQGWIMLWQEPPPVECGDMCPCARLSLSHHIVGSLSRCSDL